MFKTVGLFMIAFCLSFNAQAQTCNSSTILSAPDSRYSVKSDGTVLDTETGLMWKTCQESKSGASCGSGTDAQFSFYEAVTHTNTVNSERGFAKHKDWRIPNSKELYSLVEKSCESPALNTKIFPSVDQVGYWSASVSVDDVTNRWALMAQFGDIYAYSATTSSFGLLLVRDNE